MSLAQRLYQRLAGVTDHVHPQVLPANPELPALVYQRVDTPDIVHAHDDDGPAGLVVSRWQVAAWAQRYGDAQNLAGQVIDALDGWRSPTGTPRIDRVHLVLDLDDYERDTGRHRRLIDVVIAADERD